MTVRDFVIEGKAISKVFKLYASPEYRLKEWLSLGRRMYHKPYRALEAVDIELRRGECLGIIGSNGSGKTTLMKILSGALSPTTGTVVTKGRAYALIELATGFNKHLTGRQNIPFVGQMLGLDDLYIRERMSDIIAFSELGEFIDQPTKHYSSGMAARLGFSLFAFLEPDVLMIDEALAVGDAGFTKKCLNLLERYISSENHSAIFVSHQLNSVRNLCTRVMWIDKGRVKKVGDPDQVVNAYIEEANC